ncbi:hypothetical protein H4219_003182 [Mycoemilia scoparia]|uniref:Altered inheritance of mitochondria protein 24, mitochondrial n=1 Tax=Mycoemilia scoparia TaxID=417184 RepID=A0A9W8A178_9FUNG|nr:hypothetical protein H4219_003182 [Mycoemilia scoparia]
MLLPNSKPNPSDPLFEVKGTLVVAKMPAYSQMSVTPGSIIGQSNRIRQKTTTRGFGPIAFAKKLVLGRSALVQQVWTNDHSGEVVLAGGAEKGAISVIEMSGSGEYYVRPSSILAFTKFLSTSTWYGKGIRFDRLSGKGSFVIRGSHRLVLEKGQEFLVDPRYINAFETTMLLEPLVPVSERKPVVQITTVEVPVKTSGPSPKVGSNTGPSGNEKASVDKPNTKDAPVSRSSASDVPAKKDSSVNATTKKRRVEINWKEIYQRAVQQAKKITGGTEQYRLVGPGEFYITTNQFGASVWQRLSLTPKKH